MASHKTRHSINRVRSTFPPGTLLRHVANGRTYMIGVKFGIGNFWMLGYEPPKRFLEHAASIVNNYDRADSQVRELAAPQPFQYRAREVA